MASAEVFRFEIGPLTIPIAADALSAWIERASAGEQLCYATGPAPLQNHATFVLARAQAEAGRVTLFQPRRGDSLGFDFVVRRIADRQADASPAPRVAATDDIAERVYARLKNLAALGHPCDTDAELAQRFRLRNADAASYVLRKLKDRGQIRVENRGPLERRIVTIVATGKATTPKREAR